MTIRKALTVLLALTITCFLPAQTIRTNYRSGGFTHISTEAERLQEMDIRVEQVGLPDGETLFQLRIDLRQKTAFTAPKNVKMTATLSGGALLRADQIGQDSPTKSRLEDGTFLNRLRYALEPADMERLLGGVQALELVYGWNPDDYLQFRFSDDAFSALLRRHCEAIREAAGKTVEITVDAAGRIDQSGSVMTASQPLVADGKSFKYNIILNHLYYKATASEDMDLAFQIGADRTWRIPADAPVTFLLEDGTGITLPQTRDDENFVYLYPTLDQLRALAYGSVSALRLQTEEGILQDSILDDSFSKAVNQQYQLLMSLSQR